MRAFVRRARYVRAGALNDLPPFSRSSAAVQSTLETLADLELLPGKLQLTNINADRKRWLRIKSSCKRGKRARRASRFAASTATRKAGAVR